MSTKTASADAAALPNVRTLLAFREVALLGSTTAAAKAIHSSQPAVTQALARLERRFGVSLFIRTSAGMTLNEAGHRCMARVDRALGELMGGIAELTRGRPKDSSGLSAKLRRLSGTQLAALSAVVDTGGFSAAARSTGLSRPSLHRSCRALERMLGVAFFEQTSFGVEPTRDAERLVRHIRLAGSEIAQALTEIEALSGKFRGRTVIGAMPLARSSLLPEAILEFSACHPDHTISILDGPYDNMLMALRHGDADLLVGALRDPPPVDDVVQEHLFDDVLAILMRPDHPLLSQPNATVDELVRFPWIAPRPGSPLRSHYEALFLSSGLEPPRGAVECNSLSAARALLRASDRLMLLSAHQISADLAEGTLKILPHPRGRVTRRIALTIRKGWRPTDIQAELIRIMRLAAARVARSP